MRCWESTPLSSSDSRPKAGHALAALSGGVDSATAALLALRAGLQVTAVTFRMSAPPPASVREVCATLGIEHIELDLTEQFRKEVIATTVSEYAAGRTPNPCVVCNPRVKFAALARLAKELGCDTIITGHYARVRRVGGEWHLLRGRDRSKDQSYMLYRLPQSILAMLMLPLGELTKVEVRQTAEDAGLPVARRPESQDVCFAPDGDVAALVAQERPEAARPGPIIDRTGAVLGHHRGLVYYTIGQRRGLGLGGPGGPYYVQALLPDRNAVVVGSDEQVWVDSCEVEALHLVGTPPASSFEANVMTRYRGRETPARITITGDGALIRFKRPHRAPAPGQSAVFYEGERLIGGGVIVPPPLHDIIVTSDSPRGSR